MGDTQHFELLRSEYRQRWDAYQVLAYRNAELAHAGQPPSPVERADEQRAAAAVERARDELLAAVSHLGEPPTQTGVPMSGTHGGARLLTVRPPASRPPPSPKHSSISIGLNA